MRQSGNPLAPRPALRGLEQRQIERFFRPLQESFFPELSFEPAADLEQLNRRLWHWIENGYHRRAHAALGGKTPLERFGGVRLRPLPENWQALFYERISR